MKVDGLIERLDDEGYPDIADDLRAGATVEASIVKLETGFAADTDAIRLIERWKKNRHGKEREVRQRKRLQREARDLGERTGERDRARRDRANLKRWIEEHTGMAVTGKSGSWTVTEREEAAA